MSSLLTVLSPAHGGGGGNTPVVTVVASNAPAVQRAGADFRCDGVDDDVEINAAIASLGSAGGTVVLSTGTFVVSSTITIPSRVRLLGQGTQATIIKQADGANLEAVIESHNFSELQAGNVWKDADGMQHGMVLDHFSVDGNKENNTAETTGIRFWAKGWYIGELAIWNCHGDGFFSGAGQTGTINSLDDSNQPIIHRLYCGNIDRHGIRWLGPSDGVIQSYTCGFVGKRGLSLEAHSIDLNHAHVWGCGQEGIYAGGVQLRANHVQSETNNGAGLVFNSLWGSYVAFYYSQIASNQSNAKQNPHIEFRSNNNVVGDAYLRSESVVPTQYGVLIRGNNNRFSGLLDQLRVTNTLVQVGLPGEPVSHNTIDVTVRDSQGRVLDIVPGGGGNTIRVTANMTGDHWDGEKNTTDIVVYNGGDGALSQNSGIATLESGNTSVEVPHGLVRGPQLSDLQITPVTSLGNASLFWISDPNSTDFTINVDTDPGQNVSFAWSARIDSAEPPEDPVVILAEDTFTDLDGTLLVDHVSDSGHSWMAGTGSLVINSNRIDASAGTGHATIDVGQADGIYKLAVNLGPQKTISSGDVQLILNYRYADQSNRYFARLIANGMGIFVSGHRVQNGSFSIIIPQQSLGSWDTEHILEVEVRGDTHTLRFDGVVVGSATSAFNNGATRVGVGVSNNTSLSFPGQYIDNFVVQE